MNPSSRKDGWVKYRMLSFADPDAAERGRLLTAQLISNDPEARSRIEDGFGVEFCRQMYPEAYRNIARPGIAGILDRVRNLTPW